jgi:hypothetical protein
MLCLPVGETTTSDPGASGQDLRFAELWIGSMISASSIIAAMSDVRPGRFYSVDELAAVLRIPDKAALHEQLRTMAGDPDIHSPFRLLQGASGDFYRRVAFAPMLTLCEPWESQVS